MWKTEADKQQGRLRNLFAYFVEYTRIAEIHGIRFLSRRTAFERLLWGSLTLCCVLVCLAQIIKLCSRLYKSPVVVTFGTEAVNVYEVPFPAVTICPESKTDRRQFNYHDNRIKFENKKPMTDYEQRSYEYIFSICDHLDISQQTNYFKERYFDQDFYNTVSNLSVTWSKMAIGCKWKNSVLDCSQLFTRVFIDEGVCYSFNILHRNHIFKNVTSLPDGTFETFDTNNNWKIESGYPDRDILGTYPKRVYTSGADHSLKIYLLENSTNFDFDCKSSLQGFRVIIHNPLIVPQASRNYFRLSPDCSAIAAVMPTLIHTAPDVVRFNAANRNCYMELERPLKYFKKYTQDNCWLECLSNYTLLRCECVSYYMPRTEDIPICGGYHYHCVLSAQDELELIEIKNKLNNKTKSLSFCDCLPSCSSLHYDFEVTASTPVWQRPVEEENRKTMSELIIYFQHSAFVKLERNEVFSTFDLLAKIGGLFGLCTGASVITLVELIYYWSGRIICNVRLFGHWYGEKN
ncbi:hypothetical protein MTP99_007162 [Tenebrio molitor]|nr:hypothetical protein MTP99_007162 [Tenebrio molitor]